MPTIHTIGYTKKSLEEFVRRLQEADVGAVIDVRLRNRSQLAGFAKRDDLGFLLREGFGIEYEHRPELAPTAEILEAYKAGGDWEAYEESFRRLLDERETEHAGRDVLSRYQRPCLLCSEPDANQCHRRLVAEWWKRHLPSITIIHL